MKVTGLGRISVYKPRGAYQVILEYLEPEGVGAFQLAFEQLKQRLLEEGLFDEKHKRPLPFLPQKICIITSPTGAVVHDILRIIDRRFPNVHLEIMPVKVQGHDAENEIVSALETLNTRGDADICILARGGGSIEDFHAFNSEKVARAIYVSTIPIISAVGHETDFCISDFVADLRAPTPSAAAELAVPLKRDLQQRCDELSINLNRRFYKIIEHLRKIVDNLQKRLPDPKKKIVDYRLKLDDLTLRSIRLLRNNLVQKREKRSFWHERLKAGNPISMVNKFHEKLDIINNNLLLYIRLLISKNKFLLNELNAKFHALNPHAVLERGYSITRTIPEATIVRDSQTIAIGQDVEVTLASGRLVCNVKGK
jgi:exodeoxyribonuclease VII large subunit